MTPNDSGWAKAALDSSKRHAAKKAMKTRIRRERSDCFRGGFDDSCRMTEQMTTQLLAAEGREILGVLIGDNS
jgi:hypothetical protein